MSEDASKAAFTCVKSVLVEVLGEKTAEVILYHIGYETCMKDVDAFARTLEKIFGSGAAVLEKRILERLYAQAGRTFQEKQGYRFTDYVNEINSAGDTSEVSNKK